MAQRILYLEYQLILDDVVQELKDRGHVVFALNPSSLTVQKFIQTCRQSNIDWVFSINFSPEIAFLCSKIQIPYVSWTIDPLPHNRFHIIEHTDPAYSICFAHDKNTVQKLQSLGFFHSQFMPLAAPNRRIESQTLTTHPNRYRCDCSFVGSSMNDELIQFKNMLQKSSQLQHYEEILLWLQQVTFEYVLHPSYQGLQTLMENSAIPSTIQHLFETPHQKEIFFYHIDGILAALHRRHIISMLNKKSHNMHVWGDMQWKEIHSGYQRRAHHGDELTEIYRNSSINFDIPRLYQKHTINMRVFDVLAAGGFVLTEETDAIQNIFVVDEHIAIYNYKKDSQKAVGEQISWWLEHPMERKRIAELGQQEVLEKHLISHRVDTILQYMQEHFFVA